MSKHQAIRTFYVQCIGLGLWVLVLCASTVSDIHAESTLPTIAPTTPWDQGKYQLQFHKDLIPPLQEGLSAFDAKGELPAVYDIFYVDPKKLILIEPADIEVYFGITRDGAPRALGVNFDGMGVDEGTPQIVFPDVKSLIPYEGFYQGLKNEDFTREGVQPLLPGDVVSLGKHQTGESLNFFLCNADGSPSEVYTGNKKLNPGKEAAMMVMAVPEAGLILVSYRDPDSESETNYFDYVFIVTVGEANAAHWLENNGVRSPLRSLLSIKDATIMALTWCLNIARKYGWPVLIIGIIVLAILAWRSYLLMRRRRRRKRADALYKQAEQNLAAQPPIQNMLIIRKGQQLDRGTKNEKRWDGLLMKSGAISRDFSTLLDCASTATEAFEHDESISLFTARAAAELGRQDLFEQLHNLWDARSEQKTMWSTLEADSFTARHRYQNAQSSLELAGASSSSVQARLAFLKHRTNPAEGWAVLKTIQKPTPEVYRFQARMLERDGKVEEAEKAYRAALNGNPSDIFLMDEAAEFYRHNGNMKRALSIWSKILLPSTPEEIWAKALFFARVSGHPLEGVTPDKIPLTAPKPLLHALLTWPPGMFWNEHAMNDLLQQHPEIGSWQVIFWMRLIESLVTKKEGEALAQLNMARAGEFSWERALELMLISVFGYRRAGIIPSEITHIIENYRTEAPRSQVEMLKWVNPEQIDEMLNRSDIFLRLFNAVGWGEVVKALQKANTPPQP